MQAIKRVLVTGCSTGIGRALALQLAEQGCLVYATARRPESIADLQSAQITPLPLDVLDQQSIDAAVSQINGAGGVDMLVNNAGISLTAPLVETEFARVRSVVETNLLGCIAMIQAVFPLMADSGAGRIVNVGSVVGELPVPFTATYCATKAGLHMLSDVLRLELAPFGIDVVTVQPAAVASEIEARSGVGVEVFAGEGSRYQQFYAAIRQRFEGQENVAMSAEEFAARVTPQLLAKKAPRVVAAGGNNALLRTLMRLPAGLRDRLLQREYGLPAKKL